MRIKYRFLWVGMIGLLVMLLVATINPAAAKTDQTIALGPPLAPGDVIDITAGYDFTLALTSSGDVWAWGDTPSDYKNSLTPTRIEVLSNIVAISAPSDGQHACALTHSGGVKCWGFNGDGQLGNGSTDSSLTPVDVVGLTENVIAIATGLKHGCAVMNDGTIKCWGDNEYGKLGNGTTESSLTPVSVSGINDAIAVAAGQMFTCAITRSGGVKCWGDSIELGNNRIGDSSVPVDVTGLSSGVRSISAGTNHACALTSGGGLKCWGNSLSGGLGFSETDLYAGGDIPADVVGLTSNVVAVSAGGRHTCAALSDGHVKCWGSNEYGNLGIGTDENHFLPVDVPGLGGVTAVATGEAHSCAITAGNILCWGANTSGQIGDGTTTDRWSPVNVTGIVDVVVPVPSGFRAAGPLVPEITTYIPTPLDLSPKPSVIGTNLLLAALMMLPFAVAAEFFTRTLAENEETLKRRFRPVNWIVLLQERMNKFFGQRIGKTRLGDILKVLGVMLFYGLVFSLLDKTWNPFSLKGLILFGSMTVAYGLVGVADDIIQWRRIRRWGLSAELKIRPTNMLLAALSMATTRILSLVPGLMFGTPEALDADEKQFDESKQNTLLKISGITFIVIGLLVWLPTIATGLLLKLNLPETISNLLGGLEAFLLVIFAVALENLFVQMLGFPGSFGQSLKRKSRWLWIGLLILVTFVFYHTLINPRGELAAAMEEGNVLLFLGIAAAFVLFTFGMQLYFRIRNRRSGARTTTATLTTPEPAAPPSATPTAGAALPAPTKLEVRPVSVPVLAAPVPTAPPVPETEKAPVIIALGGERPCPICGNTIKAEAKLCRFCRATFTVTVRGYCLTDHDIVEVTDAGKCVRCGGNPADLHVESRLLQAPIVRPVEAAAPVQETASGPAADTKPCPNCGQTIKAEAKICRFCRTMLDSNP
jgi:alpha-tubulin suppressor-like RCC1 family protein